jgi:S-adenosylmethionine hydrolase
MVITLLTDFGLTDPYVGSMKGVILSIHPDVHIIDITHGITPQNVDEAAFVLKNTYAYFPEHTVHVVVVDPGVGTRRAVLAVQTDRYMFLAPDNGVLKYIFHDEPDCRVFRVTNTSYFSKHVSRTFHGRDIFAPVAAHIAQGLAPEKLGEPFHDYIKGTVKKPVQGKDEISGDILYIDKFGNAVSNIEESLLANREIKEIRIKGYTFHALSETYNDVSAGKPLALIGSNGTVEISVNKGHAVEQLNLRTGDPVTVTFA